MASLQESMVEYKTQLERGTIQTAYRGLMDYIMGFRTHFAKSYPDLEVSRSVYYGYMDMTYFSVFPAALKANKLKIPIVFQHEAFRFEVWLSGMNKRVQAEYCERIQASDWDTYPVVPQGRFVDSILEHVLVNDPDFSDLNLLTEKLERGTLAFIEEMDALLAKAGPLD
ncbi:MAG: hypothetical protein CL607_10100 [Anaerolineaceae bacterium]|nr:hypothetical protein [Anaerolineaceae bacterium]